ncbi:hypothetical protein AGMMS4956_00740 [Bacteroidia bacterium]|nr:hypothetical protein AGMMS4956_00740 [Bacteroidia bacterium]
MKQLINIITIILFAGIFFSCDFEEKNINPNNSLSIAPGPLLSYTQLNNTNEGFAKRTQIGFCMMMIQQTASLDITEIAGDKYLESEEDGVFFTTTYASVVKNMMELIDLTKDNAAFVNTYAVALIWKSWIFHRLTDLYGDIPYSEAGNGYRTQIFYPKYDKQSDVYEGLIRDIELGLSLLDESAASIKGDILYHGDIEKWKRFGNSLLLRLGMRLERANPALAQSTVTKAVQNGVMQDHTDICMLQHVNGKNATENPLGTVFKSHGLLSSGTIKISNTFMQQLKSTNDPRMQVYCALPDGDTARNRQKGLINGYDAQNIKDGDPSFTSLDTFSTLNPATLLLPNAPTIYMTHAEVELLQAEAILKGWLTGAGTAQEHYEKAVRSSMKQQAIYGDAGIIKDAEIDAFLAQDLLGKATTLADQLNVLGTEFWVSTFINGCESYANWRRCGYPQLTPVSYATSPYKGTIPLRFTYPSSEYTVNYEHVKEAIEHQGADDMTTPVWWDE